MDVLNFHRLEYASPRAEALLQAQRGLKLSQNRIMAVNDRESSELRRLIDQARFSVAGEYPAVGAMLLSGNAQGGRDLFAVIYPLRQGVNTFSSFCPKASVAIYCGPVEKSRGLDQVVLGSLYGLTQAESRLAIEISKGLELKEIALRLGVSRNTIKTQLKAIFSKTGTHRQQELVRLFSSSCWDLTQKEAG